MASRHFHLNRSSRCKEAHFSKAEGREQSTEVTNHQSPIQYPSLLK